MHKEIVHICIYIYKYTYDITVIHNYIGSLSLKDSGPVLTQESPRDCRQWPAALEEVAYPGKSRGTFRQLPWKCNESFSCLMISHDLMVYHCEIVA